MIVRDALNTSTPSQDSFRLTLDGDIQARLEEVLATYKGGCLYVSQNVTLVASVCSPLYTFSSHLFVTAAGGELQFNQRTHT